MNRAQTRAMKAVIKKKVPKEDRQKVLDAIDSLDMDKILENPAILADLFKDPSKLADFVKGGENKSAEGASAESSVAETEEEAEEKENTTPSGDAENGVEKLPEG